MHAILVGRLVTLRKVRSAEPLSSFGKRRRSFFCLAPCLALSRSSSNEMKTALTSFVDLKFSLLLTLFSYTVGILVKAVACR